MSKRIGMLFVLVMASTALAGCKEGKELNEWVELTAKRRIKAREVAGSLPYRVEQQEALKAYFSQFIGLANQLKDDRKLAGKLNELLAQTDLPALCGKVYLPKGEWLEVVEHCTRNGFFLCAEEVRSYGTMVGAIRGHLSPEMLHKFNETPNCSGAL